MAEGSLGLQYGQFGELIYDAKSKVWTSKRSLKNPAAFRRIGAAVEHVPGSYSGLRDVTLEDAFSGARNKAVRRLSEAFPETDPATSNALNCLDDFSNMAMNRVNDPNFGDLLAQGTARGHDYSSGGRRDIIHNVLAIAGGECGNGVLMLEMRPSRQGWERDRSVWINTFELQLREAAWWDSGAEQVQQLCFAQRVDHDTSLLAVRSSGCITVLRPLYITTPRHGAKSRFASSHSLSRIDPNPLITLRLPLGDETDFADVAFNPLYQQQLGAVDNNGKFAIWTLSGRHIAEEYTLHGEVSNKVNDEARSRLNGDGWYKIIWIGNASSFLIAGRLCLQAFEVGGLSVVDRGIVDLDIGASTMIIDIRNDPSSLADFYVVSTTHIYCVRWKSGSISHRSSDTPASFKTILSWQHYRDATDVTLHLIFLPITDGKDMVGAIHRHALMQSSRSIHTAFLTSHTPCDKI